MSDSDSDSLTLQTKDIGENTILPINNGNRIFLPSLKSIKDYPNCTGGDLVITMRILNRQTNQNVTIDCKDDCEIFGKRVIESRDSVCVTFGMTPGASTYVALIK